MDHEDVYDVDPSENVGYRLALRMNTIGTKDDTVKFHGVKSLYIVNFSKEKKSLSILIGIIRAMDVI